MDRLPKDPLKEALIFHHHVEMQTRVDLVEARATLYALIEELAERGGVDLASLEARREVARALERERAAQLPQVMIEPTHDKYALKVLPEIDCDALFPLCHARCCKLTFALTRQDLEERVVDWEIARPYVIKHGADGRCVHQDRASGHCGVYAQRPAVCRQYDCRTDKRVWLDFANKIPAPDDAIPLIESAS